MSSPTLPWEQSPTGRRKTPLLSWQGLSQGKDTDSLFTPNFFASLLEHSLFLALQGLACSSLWLQTPSCNSLPIPNKPIFAREISGSLFVSVYHPQTLEQCLSHRRLLVNICYMNEWIKFPAVLTCVCVCVCVLSRSTMIDSLRLHGL